MSRKPVGRSGTGEPEHAGGGVSDNVVGGNVPDNGATVGHNNTDNGAQTAPDNKTAGQVKTKRKRGGYPGQPPHNPNGFSFQNGTDNPAPGENTKFLRYALVSWDLPPVNLNDPQQVEDRIKLYLEYCAEHDRKPQIIGMANWLGVDRDTINNWKRGVVRKDTHSGIIKKALALLEEQWVDYMQSGRVNPAAGIFLAKNWYGYKDVQDVVVTPQAPFESGSAEEVAQRYIDGMVGNETVDGGDGEIS